MEIGYLLLVDGAGFGFKDRYALSWRRGETLSKVRSHVRLVILALIDKQRRGILLGASSGPPYALEICLFREILKELDLDIPLSYSVVEDRGYDAVDLLESLKRLGDKPAFKMKGTLRYEPKHPMRKESQKNWEIWGKLRYRVEGFFGLIKLK